MKTRNLLYSFLAAWITSILLLMFVGFITETRYRFSGISDAIPALMLFGSTSFMILAPVWIILVVPFFYAARRYEIRPHRLLGSLAASLAGFGLMYVLMNFLSVEHKQWPIFCLIASAVGFLSSKILLSQSSLQAAIPPHRCNH